MNCRLSCLYLFRPALVTRHFRIEVFNTEKLVLCQRNQSLQLFRSELNRYFRHSCIKLSTMRLVWQALAPRDIIGLLEKLA